MSGGTRASSSGKTVRGSSSKRALGDAGDQRRPTLTQALQGGCLTARRAGERHAQDRRRQCLTGQRAAADGRAVGPDDGPRQAEGRQPPAQARGALLDDRQRQRDHAPDGDVRSSPRRAGSGAASRPARPGSSCRRGRRGRADGARSRSMAARRPTRIPACGPPSSLSPLTRTTAAPAATLSVQHRLVRQAVGGGVEQRARAEIVQRQQAVAAGERAPVRRSPRSSMKPMMRKLLAWTLSSAAVAGVIAAS